MKLKIILFFLIICQLFACKINSDAVMNIPLDSAKYVLPYPKGKSYYVFQAFNGPYTHHGVFKYAVDFTMPIGTLITAARSGRVVFVCENFSNDDLNNTNVVVIMHEDSVYSRYAHLTKNGALVDVGMWIEVDDSVGLSGSSGAVSYPHLHFDVTKECPQEDCQTIPFFFKGIDEKDGIIKSSKYYTRY